jgi:phosphodiesterase/alkaline phosphatase D-like protein
VVLERGLGDARARLGVAVDAPFTRRDFLGSAALGTATLVMAAESAHASSALPAGGGASVVGDAVWLNVRATAPGRVRARIWPTGHPESAIVTPWHATNRSNAARIAVSQASISANSWSWQGEVQDAQGLTAPMADKIRTLPRWPRRGAASAFALAFGSCFIKSRAAPVLTYAAASRPEFYAHIGDMTYVDFDGTQDYARFGLGDVDVWLLDRRRYKDPKGGPYENGKWMSVLRSTQRAWLLNGLASSPARVKVILAPMTFGYYWSRGEQSLVKDWIQNHVTGTVVLCSGDRHQTAFVHPAPNIWELLACPVNNPKKTVAYSIPGLVWVEHPGHTATSNAVGIVEVDTQTTKPHITLRAVTDSGATLHAETVNV